MKRATQRSGGAPAAEKKIIEITQEGIGRVSRAENPEDIGGLYTDGLETCVAIILVSGKGISLIHATRLLKVDRLIEEVQWHGKVVKAKFIYNPVLGYPGGAESTKFKEFMAKYCDLYELLWEMGALCASTYYADSSSGNALVELTGEIHINASRPRGLISPPHKQLRHDIQYVNSYFMPLAAEQDPDFQFDGHRFTPIPPLTKSLPEINELLRAEEDRFMGETVHGTMTSREFTGHMLRSYMSCTQQLADIEAAEIAARAAAEIAARAAAAPANTPDPRLLAKAPSDFKIGDHCKVIGLTQAPQLNNLTGVVVKWYPKAGRVRLKLDNPPTGSKDYLKIKPVNLEAIEEPVLTTSPLL